MFDVYIKMNNHYFKKVIFKINIYINKKIIYIYEICKNI